jgi:hypothetical protein
MLEKMTSQLRSALEEIVQANSKEGPLDMKRMQSLIKRDRRQLLATAETRLTDVLCDPVISGKSTCSGSIKTSTTDRLVSADFLYGDLDSKSLAGTFGDLERYEALLTWKADQWVNLLKKYVCRLSSTCMHSSNPETSVSA